MKNVLLFVGGMATGAILLLVVLFFIGKITQPEDSPINEEEKTSIYEGFENGDIIEEKSFKVFQVLENNIALVMGKSDVDKKISYDVYNGLFYLLIGKEGTTFYDDQIVKVPEGSVVRMNGTFQYTTNSGMDKTVPRIMIMDK